MLAGASVAIVVIADPEKTDVWTEDCSIVMSNMHNMAHDLGLGSCWIPVSYTHLDVYKRQVQCFTACSMDSHWQLGCLDATMAFT